MMLERSGMSRLRNFLRQHALLAGMLAVAIPLLVILTLQYNSLRTLERTLPAYRHQVMAEFLSETTGQAMSYFYDQAEKSLKVPAGFIQFRKKGIIQDDRKGEQALRAVSQVAAYFRNHQVRGAQRFFLAVEADYQNEQRSYIFYYDPASQTMQKPAEALPDTPAMLEAQAINVACAAYRIYIRNYMEIVARATGTDRSREYRIVTFPVLEESAEKDKRPGIIAVAGFVMDLDFLRDELLPEIIREQLPRFFPTEFHDAIVARFDWGDVIDEYDSQNHQKLPYPKTEEMGSRRPEFESLRQFQGILWNGSLAIRMRHQTATNWARRNSVINFSLWSLMTLLLLSGIGMALRTASREMKLSQMKSDFVSNVSHELRTPLASIRVFGEFLKSGRITDQRKVREYGGYIEAESSRLTHLINNILDFSRIESGRKTWHFESADLNHLIAETLQTFEVQLRENNFHIDWSPASEKLPQVMMDQGAISQALVNLLDNAVKYSGSARKIQVVLEQIPDAVEISVSDAGIGISSEDQEKVFERFYRVSTGLVHDVKGSGLGLALVRYIVEAHHGSISVKSSPGRGSTFTIRLPLRQEMQANAG
jgi:signal transduction histidine kinase